MKSAHRHELQTNALAQRLDVAIQNVRPWLSTIVGVILAIVAAILIWSYVSKSSAARQGDAWNSFNQAVSALPPNLEEIHQAAQEHPGTKMQELADITWADGQVYLASENYLYNRRAADEALNRAASAYESVLQTSSDNRLINRAHLGLARLYEMRNELDRAREEYQKVGGGYTEYAKRQAERLADPQTKETYAWLDKAQPPAVPQPTGPGVPGVRPPFSAGDLNLPSASPDAAAPGTATDPAASFDDLLKGLGTLPETDEVPQTPAPNSGLPGTSSTAPPAEGAATPPATSPPEAAPPAENTPPADDTPAAETGDTSPSDTEEPAAPATDENTEEEKSAE